MLQFRCAVAASFRLKRDVHHAFRTFFRRRSGSRGGLVLHPVDGLDDQKDRERDDREVDDSGTHSYCTIPGDQGKTRYIN